MFCACIDNAVEMKLEIELVPKTSWRARTLSNCSTNLYIE